MQRTLSGFAAAAFLAALPLVASAQPPNDQPSSPYPNGGQGGAPTAYGQGAYGQGGYGRGGGGPMTLDQFQARMRDRVLRADTDHDSRVSLAEWTAAMAERGGGRGGDPAQSFERMDLNHDGYVTPAEIDAVSAQRFARMDINHDGVVTPDERRRMRGGGYGREGSDGQGGAPSQPTAPQ